MTFNPFEVSLPAEVGCAICDAPLVPTAHSVRVLYQGAFFYFCGHGHRVTFKRDLDVWSTKSRDRAVPVRPPPPRQLGDNTPRRSPFTIIDVPPDGRNESPED